jgi:hypothetical protein
MAGARARWPLAKTLIYDVSNLLRGVRCQFDRLDN